MSADEPSDLLSEGNEPTAHETDMSRGESADTDEAV